jgi:hypothetical protein
VTGVAPARPAQPTPGPHDPVVTTPPRAPGSVRRTSSLDSSRPQGAGGPLVIDARARDLVTGPDGVTVTGARQVTIGLTLDDATREVLEVRTAPPQPAVSRLVGTRVVGGFRRTLGELLPDERAGRTLTHLLLDDLPGAVLVSGYALLRAGVVGVGPAPVGGDGSAHMAHMADLCAGWAADGSMMDSIRATGVIPTPYGPPAPTIEPPDDELSWHGMAPLGLLATRRRRRLDLAPGDGAGHHAVDLHFRDSYRGGESDDGGGESVVHEYTATATVDARSHRLLALTPRAQVLPWLECPGALASASRLVGATLAEVAGIVRRDLVGVGSCTHLNDTLRSLADLDALLGPA